MCVDGPRPPDGVDDAPTRRDRPITLIRLSGNTHRLTVLFHPNSIRCRVRLPGSDLEAIQVGAIGIDAGISQILWALY